MSLLRRHWPVCALLLGFAPLLFIWSSSHQIGLLGNDGPAYLMMARHYQPGVAADPAYQAAAVHSKYPPLYPLLLAAFGASDLPAAHALTAAFLLGALMVFYAWLLGEGLPRRESTMLVALVALLPGTWLTGLLIQSEYLFLLLSIGALTSLAAYQRSSRLEWLLGAAMLVALSSLTRTIGVTLFLPLFVVALRAPRRHAALVLAIAAAPVAAWHLLHRSPISYTDELEGAYGAQRWTVFLRQLSEELPALHRGFADNFARSSGPRFLADVLGIACLVGLLWRLRLLRPDGLYVAASLAILVVWPYPEEAHRFLWVLLPLLLGQVLLTVQRIMPRRFGLADAGLAACVLVMAVPALVYGVQRYRAAAQSPIPEAAHNALWYGDVPQDAERFVAIQTVMIATMSSIPEVVPASDCVVATRPDITSYFSHRYSTYPPAPSTPDRDVIGLLRSTRCHYIFSIAAQDPHRRLSPLYPLARIPGEFEPVLTCAPPDDSYRSGDPVCALVRLKDAPQDVSPQH